MRIHDRLSILVLGLFLLASPLMGQESLPDLSVSFLELPPLVDGGCKYVQYWDFHSRPLGKDKLELRTEIHLHESKLLCKRRLINASYPVVHLYEYDPEGRVTSVMNMFSHHKGNVFSYEYHDSFVEVRNTPIDDSTRYCFHGTGHQALDDGTVFYETFPKDSVSYLILPDSNDSTQGLVVRSVFHGPKSVVRKDFDRSGMVFLLDSIHIIDDSSFIRYLEYLGTDVSRTLYVRAESMEEEARSALIKRMRRKHALKKGTYLCLVYCSDYTAFTIFGPYGPP